jgi:hypothetical protein
LTLHVCTAIVRWGQRATKGAAIRSPAVLSGSRRVCLC